MKNNDILLYKKKDFRKSGFFLFNSMYLNKLIHEICTTKKKNQHIAGKKFPQNIFQTNEYKFSFKVDSENFSHEEKN